MINTKFINITKKSNIFLYNLSLSVKIGNNLLIEQTIKSIMAVGFSGSNGGVQEAYRRFVLADVGAGIRKYEEPYEAIPEEQTGTREFYKQAIEGLRELRVKMSQDNLERRV